MIQRFKYRIADCFRKTNALGVYKKIKESQWLTRENLDQLQFEYLKKLLIHSGKNIPYYVELFKKYNFIPEDIKKADDIKALPVLTKEIIRKNYDLFKAKNFDMYKPRVHKTGGSTGKPLVAYNDYWSHSYLAANNLRVWSIYSGYEPGNKFMINAHGSLLPKHSYFKRAVYFYLQNADWISNYHMDEQELLKAWNKINRSKALFIYGASSSLHLLSTFAKSKNIENKSQLKAVYTTSDMLYPNQRKDIEEIFGVPVFDSYGCPEGGIIAFECEYHNGYHINSESAYVAILSANDNGIGKIISTSLHNYAFPFIHYDTGDIGSITYEKCKCGRELPRIKELHGRIRDFVVLKDGRVIHGAFFNRFEPLYRNSWVNEYQIIQEDIDHLIIKISKLRDPTQEEKDEIKRELRKGLMADMKIDIDLDGVELTKGGKFRIVMSKVRNIWDS